MKHTVFGLKINLHTGGIFLTLNYLNAEALTEAAFVAVDEINMVVVIEKFLIHFFKNYDAVFLCQGIGKFPRYCFDYSVIDKVG